MSTLKKLPFLILTIFFLLNVHTAHAAVARSGTANSGRTNNNAGSSAPNLDFPNFNCGASATAMFVFIQNWSNTSNQISSVQVYNGSATSSLSVVSGTGVANFTNGTPTKFGIAYFGTSTAIAGTSDNVELNFSPNTDVWAEVDCYSGTALDTATLIQAVSNPDSSGSVSSYSYQLTTTAATGAWVVFGIQTNGQNLSSVTNGAIREDNQLYFGSADSNGTVTPSGTYSSTVSLATPGFTSGIMIEIAPPSSPTTPYNDGTQGWWQVLPFLMYLQPKRYLKVKR